jgi:hypothetical protein
MLKHWKGLHPQNVAEWVRTELRQPKQEMASWTSSDLQESGKDSLFIQKGFIYQTWAPTKPREMVAK